MPLFLLCILMLPGCAWLEEDERPHQGEAKIESPKMATTPKGSEKGGTKKATPKKPDARQKLQKAYKLKRRLAFEREGSISIHPVLPTEIRSVLDDRHRKLVRIQVSRSMHESWPQPGRVRYEVRWVTLRAGAELESALRRSFESVGWTATNQPFKSPMKAPKGFTVSWRIETPQETPTVVDLILEAHQPGKPLESIEALIGTAVPWTRALPTGKILGYEFGLFHATRPGSSYSDLERLAVALQYQTSPFWAPFSTGLALRTTSSVITIPSHRR